jgi:hypothetical protein
MLVKLRNSKFLLHAQHLPIDLLDLGHQRFFSLGEPDQFFHRRARNISQHPLLFRPRLTMQVRSTCLRRATARWATQTAPLRVKLMGLVGRSKNATGHDEHAAGQRKRHYPDRWNRRQSKHFNQNETATVG